MPTNTCTPSEIYGPYNQTLFLGCSIVSFDATIGWCEQATEITVKLIQDTCEAPIDQPKVYYNSNLQRIETTEADPGFMGEVLPIVGCPVYFRMENFEFCGIIQSWEKENSPNIKDGYTVKIVSPIRVLQNTQLLIGEYTGPIKPGSLFSASPPNIFNLYGFAEKIGGVVSPQIYQSSPGLYEQGDSGIDGAVFGTACGGFGGANANANGIQWTKCKNMLNGMLCAVPNISNDWTPHGRIIHKGVNIADFGAPWTNAYGLITYDTIVNGSYVSEYFVDVSECPDITDHLRFSGVNVSLMEVISRVMQETGFDYYLETLPLKNSSAAGSGIAKLIKIRAVKRTAQPTFGAIEEFVEEAENTGRLISSSVGRELRDDVTSAFMVGGPKQTVYQAYQNFDPDGDGDPVIPELDDMITPYFGEDISGNLMPVYKDSEGFWEFVADARYVNSTLEVLSFSGDFVVINERELQNAIDFRSWGSHVEDNNTDTYQPLRVGEYEVRLGIKKVKDISERVTGQFSVRDLQAWKTVANNVSEIEAIRRERDEERIYQWVNTFATQFYGKKYAVRVPYVAGKYEEFSNVPQFSEVPTNDGGWTEIDSVLGLPNNTFYSDFFKDDVGKFTTLVAFSGAPDLDLAELNPDDFLIYDDRLFLKAQVEERYTFLDKANFLYPRVVVTLPNIVALSEDVRELFYGVHGILNSQTGLSDEQVSGMYKNMGAAGGFCEFSHLPLVPDAVAFGVRSNVNSYGPWSSVGYAGGSRVEKNDGLVPWEYGGYETMQTAANTLVDAGLSNMQVAEMGSVTVAGLPLLPIGAELNGFGILGGQQLVENRASSYTSFGGSFVGGVPFNHQCLQYYYGFSWEGSFGPNITNISVSMGEQGVQTTYILRTYTPTYGAFAELNANRLKQIGQNRLAANREMRAYIQQQANINDKRNRQGSSTRDIKKGIDSKFRNIKTELKGGSPHEILGGQLLNWNSGTVPIVGTFSLAEATTEFNDETYRKKAFMSLDGLIRPFSMNGDGGLPRYCAITGSGVESTLQSYISNTSGVVVSEATGGSTALVTVRDLNPFNNPSGYDWSYVSSKHAGNKGHDIDIVARGTGIPTGGMILRHKDTGTAYGYTNDYRPLALRAPLILAGWGYSTAGKPIPNEADTTGAISSGIFKTTGTTDRFLPDFLTKSQTWPVGPLDAVFDIARGVWTVKSSEVEIYGKLLQHLGPGVAAPFINLDTGTYYYGTSGAITGYTTYSGWTSSKNIYASGTELKFKYSTSFGRWEVNNDSEVTVLLTGTVSGGTWDRNVSGLRPYLFSAPVFGIHTSMASGFSGYTHSGYLQYSTGVRVTGWHKYTETITVPNGQGYLAKVVNGWLENVDCRAVTL